ncbi:MAG TPA: HesB/YadR/YfhF-family protein [Solirubrobacterales bacterium]|nr:HesB/YadR/YfhF-family protein [Solirubrobacterales bacterium]
MLTITPKASEAIRGVLAAENATDGSVLRISPEPGVGFVVAVTDSPEPEDQIVEGEEVEVCVEPAAAQMLDDKELDATIVGGQVNFSVGDRELSALSRQAEGGDQRSS